MRALIFSVMALLGLGVLAGCLDTSPDSPTPTDVSTNAEASYYLQMYPCEVQEGSFLVDGESPETVAYGYVTIEGDVTTYVVSFYPDPTTDELVRVTISPNPTIGLEGDHAWMVSDVYTSMDAPELPDLTTPYEYIVLEPDGTGGSLTLDISRMGELETDVFELDIMLVCEMNPSE